MTEMTIRVTINGDLRVVEVPANLLLVDLLRERFGLRGTKVACDQGACGACTVLVDGLPITSCLTFAFAANCKSIVTIEGVSRSDGALDGVQQAFHDAGVPQCGFCTPGMVLLTKALLDRAEELDAIAIDSWLAANICRCSGYQIFRRALGSAQKSAS
jgi:aerobic carbon-monoxide dehydrogenase small subunit